MNRLGIVAFVIVGSSAAVAGAAGEGDAASRRAAREAFKAAQAAFARRDYIAAAEAFERAAALEPHPYALLNAAEAWDLAGDSIRAADACERALALPNVTDAQRREASARLDKLAARTAVVELRGAGTARIDAGDSLALPARRRMMPGHHTVAFIDAGGQRREIEIALRPGETRTLDAEAPPRPPAPSRSEPAKAPAPPRPLTPSSPAGGSAVPAGAWISFGVAAAGGVVAGVFGVKTVIDKQNYDSAPTHPSHDAFYRDRLLTNVALGVAAGAAVLGIVVWIAAPRRAPPPASGAFARGVRVTF